MTQLEKHEKAVRILENIRVCERQILWINDGLKTLPVEFWRWSLERIDVYKQMIVKLQRYYDNNFKL